MISEMNFSKIEKRIWQMICLNMTNKLFKTENWSKYSLIRYTCISDVDHLKNEVKFDPKSAKIWIFIPMSMKYGLFCSKFITEFIPMSFWVHLVPPTQKLAKTAEKSFKSQVIKIRNAIISNKWMFRSIFGFKLFICHI